MDEREKKMLLELCCYSKIWRLKMEAGCCLVAPNRSAFIYYYDCCSYKKLVQAMTSGRGGTLNFTSVGVPPMMKATAASMSS